jgi:Tfp pilus assembly protein PilX
MRNRIREEDGWVLVTAMLLLSIMLMMGVAALGLADDGTQNTRQQRERESALALDEGVLYAQGFVLASKWPSAADPYPASCTEVDAPTNAECPNKLTLSKAQGGASANFQDVDHAQDAQWTTRVRDNGGTWLNVAYDSAKADLAQAGCEVTPCTYDANGDKRMWVQSRSLVRGKPRNVVALLQLEELPEAVPRAGVVAGGIDVSNNGNHGGTPIIDASGSQVVVRCDPGTTSPPSACLNYVNGQITPAPITGAQPNLMTPAQLARMKSRAISDGRYYPGCPTPNENNKYDLNGQVVWVENCYDPPNIANNNVTTTCVPPSNSMSSRCVNSAAKPGVLIWHCGVSDLQASFTYVGVWYMANNSDGTCAPRPAPLRTTLGDGKCDNADDFVMHTNGGFAVWGALTIDGQGCLDVGSNGLQVKFNPNAFGGIMSYGTVGLVQNTWRELPANAS